MPIYEYNCKKCDHDFEAMHKMNDSGPSACPQCESVDIVRLVSASNFKLKGKGWYATDFKDKDKEPAQSDDAQTKDNKTAQKDSDSSKQEISSTKEAKKDNNSSSSSNSNSE